MKELIYKRLNEPMTSRLTAILFIFNSLSVFIFLIEVFSGDCLHSLLIGRKMVWLRNQPMRIENRRQLTNKRLGKPVFQHPYWLDKIIQYIKEKARKKKFPTSKEHEEEFFANTLLPRSVKKGGEVHQPISGLYM